MASKVAKNEVKWHQKWQKWSKVASKMAKNEVKWHKRWQKMK